MEHSTLGVGAEEEDAQLLGPGRTDQVEPPLPSSQGQACCQNMYPLLAAVTFCEQMLSAQLGLEA